MSTFSRTSSFRSLNSPRYNSIKRFSKLKQNLDVYNLRANNYRSELQRSFERASRTEEHFLYESTYQDSSSPSSSFSSKPSSSSSKKAIVRYNSSSYANSSNKKKCSLTPSSIFNQKWEPDFDSNTNFSRQSYDYYNNDDINQSNFNFTSNNHDSKSPQTLNDSTYSNQQNNFKSSNIQNDLTPSINRNELKSSSHQKDLTSSINRNELKSSSHQKDLASSINQNELKSSSHQKDLALSISRNELKSSSHQKDLDSLSKKNDSTTSIDQNHFISSSNLDNNTQSKFTDKNINQNNDDKIIFTPNRARNNKTNLIHQTENHNEKITNNPKDQKKIAHQIIEEEEEEISEKEIAEPNSNISKEAHSQAYMQAMSSINSRMKQFNDEINCNNASNKKTPVVKNSNRIDNSVNFEIDDDDNSTKNVRQERNVITLDNYEHKNDEFKKKQRVELEEIKNLYNLVEQELKKIKEESNAATSVSKEQFSFEEEEENKLIDDYSNADISDNDSEHFKSSN